MSDSVSVTSHHSYGSRVGNSIKNIFGGIILVIGSIILLVWNENNFIQQKKALEEGAAVVQEATADQLNPDLEGKEIHVYGQTTSEAEALIDNDFNVTTDDLKLLRTVEMYQWEEEQHEECHDNYGGSEDCTTTYTYDKLWSDQAINSSNFYKSAGHENPTSREYNSVLKEKDPITLGVYTLTSVFKDQLTNYTAINLSEQSITTPQKYQLIVNSGNEVEDNNNEYLYGNTNNAAKFHITSDYIYIGVDPANPEIGDLKISFSSIKPGSVSIVGKQLGSELTSYTVSNGRSIALLSQGNVSADDMFLEAQQANKAMTWIIRLVGLLLMYGGFAMLFQFIETIAKVLPFLSNIIGIGTGIIAFGLTLIVGFLTIGIAWLAVRPAIGITCLVITVLGIILLKRAKKNKAEEPKSESTKK